MKAWKCFRRSKDIRGKLGTVPVGQHHLNPQKYVLQKSLFYTKLLKGLKVKAWITFCTPTDIRGKLGAVPVGQHHLDPQEYV